MSENSDHLLDFEDLQCRRAAEMGMWAAGRQCQCCSALEPLIYQDTIMDNATMGSRCI